MINLMLLLSTLAAFVVAIMGLLRPLENWVQRIYAWMPLPALLIGLYSVISGGLGVSTYPNLMLGVQIGLDDIGRAFVILISAVWLVAGIFSHSYFTKDEQFRIFRFHFLITYSGTIGLAMALDATTFYAGYALMTLGGYGLITHTRTAAALVAGRVYMIVALIGEMMALAGLIIAASNSQTFAIHDLAHTIATTPSGTWSFWLIFIGFGTKVGLVPFHFWLPRSYYWAPLPAVAVLSAAMTKAGVLGWLRFLLPTESFYASVITLAAGALMTFYGVLVGLVQTRAKTTLAFSSLSQMGYLTMGVAALVEPQSQVSKSIAAIVAYSFHHGLTKLSLFLGLGLLARPELRKSLRNFVLGTLIFASLALIGLPLTSGAYAKSLLKAAGAADGFWHSIAGPLMTLGSVGTTVLMMRFLVLCIRGDRDQVLPAQSWASWGFSFVLILGAAWMLPLLLVALNFDAKLTMSFSESLNAFFPVLLGSIVALLLTYKLWTKHSHLTPRPLDTVLQRAYKAAWEDFPREIDEFVSLLAHLPVKYQLPQRFETMATKVVNIAQNLKMSWFMGCTLLMMIGLMLWAFLAGGKTW